jgi:hypothetical protein
MPSRSNWIPSKESALIDLTKVWQLKLLNQSLQTAYGWVAQECTRTVASLTAFVSAYDAYHSTPTHPNRMAKDIARETAKSAMRKFASERIRFNPKMTPPAAR